jgi:hypothetical protein
MSILVGSLRPSQVITPFGPGAVVDFRRSSVMIAGLDNWRPTENLLIDEPRLARALRVRGLYQVTDGSGDSEHRRILPSVLFPRYMVCRRCRRLSQDRYQWHAISDEFRCTDRSCRKEVPEGETVFPARFIVACERSHVDEFPWLKYVHGKAGSSCTGPLQLHEPGRVGTIGDVYVLCQGCGARRSMGDAFDPDQRSRTIGPCPGLRPWLVGHEVDSVVCPAETRAVLRGASNVYFPLVRSALSIPPWSERIHEAIARRERDLAKVTSLEQLSQLLGIANFEDLDRWTPAQIWAALEKRRGLIPLQVEDLLYPEWEALRNPIAGGADEFETALAPTPPNMDSYIAKVVLVHRLKEVRALQAFTRIESWADLEAAGVVDPLRLGPLSADHTDWLPALLVRGEGIFLELRESSIREWEGRAEVRKAHSLVGAAHQGWRADRGLPPASPPPARYILLHSLSHLLIRQLSLECGYSSSALRERIYASDDVASPMSGVLIYTATADSEGTLGGLVDLGRPERLAGVLGEALNLARLCASDPLCADSVPGDRGLMNGAACHACLLLSETSCERSNRFLDRGFVVSTLATLQTEFFRNN